MGYWPEKYAQGEKLLRAYHIGGGQSEEYTIRQLKYYVDNGYTSTMAEWQSRAEFYERTSAGRAGANALFGPVDRSKENTNRIWELTASMAADTGKHHAGERGGGGYAPEVQTMFVVQNPDGTYLAPSGWRVFRIENARQFYTREEAQEHRKTNQEIVEV